jgi:hypothetical protein
MLGCRNRKEIKSAVKVVFILGRRAVQDLNITYLIIWKRSKLKFSRHKICCSNICQS